MFPNEILYVTDLVIETIFQLLRHKNWFKKFKKSTAFFIMQ
jgi:hypothetical protein